MVDLKLGVIFDMDGVLVDSAEAHFQAWTRLSDEISVPFSRDEFEESFGMHNRQILHRWLAHRTLTGERIEAYSAKKEAYYRDVARGCLQPIPGAVALVQGLRQTGFRLAVGSSGPKENVDLALETLGVADAFQAFSTGDDVERGKPHPEVFLKAAERLGLHPGRCLVIEDAPQGIEAGLAAGTRVVAVCTSRPPEELRDAHLVVRSPSDLSVNVIRRLLEYYIAKTPA